MRDPFGFRPLVIGKKGGATVVASETCALDLIDASYQREVSPGEVVCIDKDGGVRSEFLTGSPKNPSFCSFEPIYFSRPDSIVFSEKIYAVRKKLGAQLAQEFPAEGADLVIAVPDSGVPMAMGYSQFSGIPHEIGLVRNHYIGRTFIEPSQSIRDFGVRLKLNPVREVIDGKKIVVVDDSIVRDHLSKNYSYASSGWSCRDSHASWLSSYYPLLFFWRRYSRQKRPSSCSERCSSHQGIHSCR